jgi:hypothetical protein
MNAIRYESLAKWKYRLTAELVLQSRIRGIAARTEYIQIWDDGTLILRKGYAWNGASGPTIDTENSMAASAGHDALYQLIALHVIPVALRWQADMSFRRWLIEDGMSAARADVWYAGVRNFGGLFV